MWNCVGRTPGDPAHARQRTGKPEDARWDRQGPNDREAPWGLRRIDVSRVVAEIAVDGETVNGHAATVGKDGGIEFDLTLPFLPFYVPKDLRRKRPLARPRGAAGSCNAGATPASPSRLESP